MFELFMTIVIPSFGYMIFNLIKDLMLYEKAEKICRDESEKDFWELDTEEKEVWIRKSL